MGKFNFHKPLLTIARAIHYAAASSLEAIDTKPHETAQNSLMHLGFYFVVNTLIAPRDDPSICNLKCLMEVILLHSKVLWMGFRSVKHYTFII